MDYLTGIAWVRFVTECVDDIRRGARLFGHSATIIIIRNRWSFVGSLPIGQPRKRICTANDNARD